MATINYKNIYGSKINPRPRNKKWIIILLVVLIPILLFYAFYFIRTKKQQTIFSEKLPYQISKETESWNLYKSVDNGFEIKYPSNYLYEEPYPNNVNFYPSNESKSFASDKTYPIHIKFMKISSRALYSQMDRKRYKLNDIEIIKFFPTSDQSMLNAIVYINDKTYEVWVNGFEKYGDRAIFDKMLPTLKTLK